MGQEVYGVSLSHLVTRESREATMLELSETGEYTSQRWECWSISHEGAAVGVCHIRPSYSTSTLSECRFKCSLLHLHAAAWESRAHGPSTGPCTWKWEAWMEFQLPGYNLAWPHWPLQPFVEWTSVFLSHCVSLPLCNSAFKWTKSFMKKLLQHGMCRNEFF